MHNEALRICDDGHRSGGGEIVMAALQQSGKITRVRPSYSAPEVTYVLNKLKKAVAIIEDVALNPHMEIGRRRLMREFHRLL
jgi:hypothetical protein